jgi:hypothetical protein
MNLTTNIAQDLEARTQMANSQGQRGIGLENHDTNVAPLLRDNGHPGRSAANQNLGLSLSGPGRKGQSDAHDHQIPHRFSRSGGRSVATRRYT